MRALVVIGGGAGGVPAAIRGAQLGGRVAIIACENLGGLCMNRGCIPFGRMIAASEILGNMLLGKDMGVHFTGVSKDYSALIGRQDEIIGLMREGVKGTFSTSNPE